MIYRPPMEQFDWSEYYNHDTSLVILLERIGIGKTLPWTIQNPEFDTY